MRFTELTKNGKFIVTSELGPPKGFHIEKALHEAEMVWPYVHAINVTDNQSSVMRLGGLAMCKVLKEKNIEPVFQVTCRDRNRLALQSDILSAALFGIDNLLLLTGDHTTLGDHKDAKPVFDLDSVSLSHMVRQLEAGRYSHRSMQTIVANSHSVTLCISRVKLFNGYFLGKLESILI